MRQNVSGIIFHPDSDRNGSVIRRIHQEWRFDTQYKYSANDQAYRLFTLALAGQPEKGAMNRLRESAAIPQLSRWLLAAAFATTGRPEAAGDLLDVRNTETEPEYCYYYYGSPIRDKSIILYTLTLLKNQERALPLLKEICDKISVLTAGIAHSRFRGDSSRI